MDVRLDILIRNHQAWLNSNDGRPSMVTESAPVLTSNVSLADTFFVLVHRQQVRVFSPPVCSRVLVLLTALLAPERLNGREAPDYLGVGPAP